MQGEPFSFTYCEKQYEAFAEFKPDTNGIRRYRLAFPNIQSIVEGTVHVAETPKGEWMIERFMSVHPVPEEFLNSVCQGFAEFINSQKAY
ncbi:MAG TPA: hypothetical protein VFI33_12155 [Puia sp.]|nr:hypothetical protein [Puia sp.]